MIRAVLHSKLIWIAAAVWALSGVGAALASGAGRPYLVYLISM